ncbi:hypothetical protein CH063_05006 [Colletotrichum higginsianum]|uniref:Secreted protein n=2 Tax=Colletotrichum higginsianum TaxID=80884 RepID=H1UXG5_COLHI|nr:hypothetical protein CH63R_14264 [Colletotrichum higginsianum IMI 349063]OBR03038.1 hypothetical protein CH63R_14264 [Colletotrichum higginsianum IMI 349063]TIC90949.1 putative secreted protein [Colletotrichum higginsianum]GJD05051.1 hypothetical protein ColKHC_13876 [Colletotrichum higginsianum]CCF32666.1 hypothetical protein CH063_05006 [Colletotrichum higginsianum]
MYFSSLLFLGLAATASAIDVRGHYGGTCDGAYVGCANINPNVCCVISGSASSGRTSVSVAAIPGDWRIRTQAYTGGGCSSLAGQLDSNGNTFVCLSYSSRGDRTGGQYWFVGRKRADDNSCPAEQPGGGKCEAVAKPDTLGLADGTEYNITGLSDEKLQELEKIATTGAGADAVPAEFQTLRR